MFLINLEKVSQLSRTVKYVFYDIDHHTNILPFWPQQSLKKDTTLICTTVFNLIIDLDRDLLCWNTTIIKSVYNFSNQNTQSCKKIFFVRYPDFNRKMSDLRIWWFFPYLYAWYWTNYCFLLKFSSFRVELCHKLTLW